MATEGAGAVLWAMKLDKESRELGEAGWPPWRLQKGQCCGTSTSAQQRRLGLLNFKTMREQMGIVLSHQTFVCLFAMAATRY